jgi:glycerophosphoryl diester phosphodiesterase
MPIESPVSTATIPPVCIAHRGASGREPENTLRAFDLALSQGATWQELDVRLVHDRVLVIHDDTLDRTTSGLGRLSDHPLSALREMDAGRGQRIPFLEEVLELTAGRSRLIIELKDSDALPRTVAILQDAVAANQWRPEHFLLSSFDWGILERARDLEPAIPLAPLAGKGAGNEVLEAAVRLSAEGVHISRWSARAKFVGMAHARGLAVRVYPVNRRWEFDLMIRLGVDGIFTDYPGQALSWGARAPAVTRSDSADLM